jgi:hypothetical protein
MRRHAHALARRVLGRGYPRALQRWRRAQGATRARRRAAATRRFVAWHGLEVSGGPFAGLRYTDARPLTLVPKLLGIYERELHGVVEDAIRAGPGRIVNVGAADGYYAVGLARRCPDARTVVFEADDDQRALLNRVIAANGVTADVRGVATIESLREVAGDLVVMDCEGCERALLDPSAIPWLVDATIIVELHDVWDPGVGAVVTDRFAATHEIVVIPSGPQPARGVLSEQRPGPMSWAVMTLRRAPRA